MNKKIAIVLILLSIYMLLDNIIKGNVAFSIYYLIGLFMLIAALVWEIRNNKVNQLEGKRQAPYLTFPIAFVLAGHSMDKLINNILGKATLLIIYYSLSVSAFTILTIYEYIRFFNRRRGKSSKLLYGITLGLLFLIFVIVIERLIHC